MREKHSHSQISKQSLLSFSFFHFDFCLPDETDKMAMIIGLTDLNKLMMQQILYFHEWISQKLKPFIHLLFLCNTISKVKFAI